MSAIADARIDDMFEYVEERCLWQFFSRTWDREENINGVLAQAGALLCGKDPVRTTPMDRLYYADALVMVSDFRQRFPWAAEVDETEVGPLLEGLKSRLVDTTITRSTNRELNHHLY
ncbi:V-containing nitrogenase subunit delta [Plasticicumulans acidivorans]|uniref:nitrogenase n=1 Tax=Plasticicumulans acidivorans TaxID=886464 RepID=A0A317MYX0_9GAMM|nr:V-containing nitrogenase subunit delta [Plasticicumulans acidivorans]PWV60992.1 V-nitrogenase VFe protein subunit VnfG [Plasticicumulans acidivorans]